MSSCCSSSSLGYARAILHSIVALLNLANLLNDASAAAAIGKAFAQICVVYGVCFAAYFWISRAIYLRSMHLLAI